ncbi:response regulator [Kineococcus terrestris]|uniref:response regulator n=1 Tax=Kineococcus terrestris TaxID=2044856 RepID=UPI0034DB5C6D
MSTAALRVLVVDDHRAFREGLRRLLGLLEDVEAVGEAASGEEALAQVLALQPDVVLMDLAMPGAGGVEAIRRLRESHPHLPVVALTMSGDDASVLAAVRAGARGYLLKGCSRSELERALRAVAAGDALFTAPVAQLLSRSLADAERDGGRDGSRDGRRDGGRWAPAEPFPQLTAREREVLRMVGQGLPTAVIAARLGLAPKTVRNHVSSVFVKIGVGDRTQAALRAREAGLGPPP